jgi:hypothetical protein
MQGSTPAHPAPPASCRRPALVVAHPGHELRVYGWLERERPLVFVLTDGSGSGGEARLDSTTALLAQTGARAGAVYGVMSDREVYSAILSRDCCRFTTLASELAEALAAHGADCVAGDAVEGYNPSHDVCRLVINAALRLAGAARGGSIPAYDFPLVGAPQQCPEALRDGAVWLQLDDAALERKLAAARSYRELAGEVEAALERYGVAPFRTECLRPVDLDGRYGWDPERVPYYETFGERRVAEGVYDRVLRFREHVAPIADALWSHSERHA